VLNAHIVCYRGITNSEQPTQQHAINNNLMHILDHKLQQEFECFHNCKW